MRGIRQRSHDQEMKADLTERRRIEGLGNRTLHGTQFVDLAGELRDGYPDRTCRAHDLRRMALLQKLDRRGDLVLGHSVLKRNSVRRVGQSNSQR